MNLEKEDFTRSINISRLEDEAQAKRVSIHLLIKRLLYYRPTKREENCHTCQYSDSILWPDETVERLQCEWVGHQREFYADLKPDHVCNFFKHGFKWYKLQAEKEGTCGKELS